MCGVCCSALLLTASPAKADNLKAAQRLLAVGSVREQFETQTRLQARAIIRHYDVIVASSAAMQLPDTLKRDIADCYESVYAWEKFEPGITQIFADNLTEKELLLLTDFYDNLGLPPGDIAAFKAIIAKANAIQSQSLEYIFEHSASCVESDVERILDYVFTQGIEPLPPSSE